MRLDRHPLGRRNRLAAVDDAKRASISDDSIAFLQTPEPLANDMDTAQTTISSIGRRSATGGLNLTAGCGVGASGFPKC